MSKQIMLDGINMSKSTFTTSGFSLYLTNGKNTHEKLFFLFYNHLKSCHLINFLRISWT